MFKCSKKIAQSFILLGLLSTALNASESCTIDEGGGASSRLFVPASSTNRHLAEEREGDLKHLVGIYNACDSLLKTNAKDPLEFLRGISACSQKIKHNFANLDCIRNKYSTVSASDNGRVLRNEGISFVELKHLGEAIEGGTVTQEVLDQFKVEMLEEIQTLKSKVLFALGKEKDHPVSETSLRAQIDTICAQPLPSDLGKPLEFIPRFAHFFYDQLVLTTIRKELILFDKLDFSQREDRYVWARLLVKVGELLHSDELSDSYGLSYVFKPVTSLRGKLVHAHAKLLIRIEEAEQKVFQKLAGELFKLLDPVADIMVKSLQEMQFKNFEISSSYFNQECFTLRQLRILDF